jgi:hypothetical protein
MFSPDQLDRRGEVAYAVGGARGVVLCARGGDFCFFQKRSHFLKRRRDIWHNVALDLRVRRNEADGRRVAAEVVE